MLVTVSVNNENPILKYTKEIDGETLRKYSQENTNTGMM